MNGIPTTNISGYLRWFRQIHLKTDCAHAKKWLVCGDWLCLWLVGHMWFSPIFDWRIYGHKKLHSDKFSGSVEHFGYEHRMLWTSIPVVIYIYIEQTLFFRRHQMITLILITSIQRTTINRIWCVGQSIYIWNSRGAHETDARQHPKTTPKTYYNCKHLSKNLFELRY